MESLKIHLLGEFRVYRGEERIDLLTKPIKSLFAYLVTHRDRGYPPELLAGTFWGDYSEEKARDSLNNALSVLRRTLPEGSITTEYGIIRFKREIDYWLDVEDFEQGIRKCKGLEKPEGKVDWLQEAVRLYRGDFMEGFYDDWCLLEQERLRELYLEALKELADCHKALKEYDRAIDCCRRILEISPLREELHRELMYLYFISGDRTAALLQYERCREVLVKELKIEPLPETKALYKEIQWQANPERLRRISASARRTEFLLSGYTELGAPFVGRDQEFGELLAQWQLAGKGKGNVVFIEGEAGIGKSRLARELINFITERESLALIGRCSRAERSLPYQPLISALRQALARMGIDRLRKVPPLWLGEVVRLLPEVGEMLPEVQPNPSLPPEQERSRLFEGLNQFIFALSQDNPLVLFIDDLHWADNSTLQYLHYLARRMPREQILLLGTYRSEEVDETHSLSELIEQLHPRGSLVHISLEGLNPQEAALLVRRMLQLEKGAEFVADLYRETEGNPFFIVELIKSLIGGGALYLEEGQWQPPPPEEVEAHIPAAVRELVSARLRRVSPRGQKLLELAAVAIREVKLELLASINSLAEDELLHALEELKAAHLLWETDQGCRYCHEIFRQVVYEGIGPARRRRLHRLFGQALEAARGTRGDEVIGELSYHFSQAKEHRRALAYLLKGAERARKAYAFREATAVLGQALRLMEEIEAEEIDKRDLWERRFCALSERVELHSLLGERKEEAEGIEELYELAHRLRDDEKLSEVHHKRSKLYQATGRYPQALEAGLQGLELKRTLKDRHGEAAALIAVGAAHQSLGEHERALEYYAKSHALYEQIGDKLGEAQAATEIGLVYRHLGKYSQALREIESALMTYRKVDERFQEAYVLAAIGLIEGILGRYDCALKYYRGSLRIRQEIGDRRGEGAVLNNRGSTYWRMERYDEALGYFQAALRMWEEVGYRRGEEATLNNLGTVQADLGRYEEALDLFGRAGEINRKTGSMDMEVENLSRRSVALLHLGRRAEALKSSNRAVELLRERKIANPHEVYFRHYRLLAELEQERAKEYLERAYEAMMEIADRIEEGEWRRSFLSNVSVNRVIAEAWERQHMVG